MRYKVELKTIVYVDAKSEDEAKHKAIIESDAITDGVASVTEVAF